MSARGSRWGKEAAEKGAKPKAGGKAQKLVQIDLNNPEFLDVLFKLEQAELVQCAKSLEQIRKLAWDVVYKHPGLKWEAIKHIKAPNDSTVYSVRLSQKIRALAYRDGDFMRFLSLHPDHDSAYQK